MVQLHRSLMWTWEVSSFLSRLSLIQEPFYSCCFICTSKVNQVTSSYLETILSFRSMISLPTMRHEYHDYLQATSLATEVNELKIIFDSQTSLHPLCESHSSIYFIFEGMSAIQVDIRAHCWSCFGWGALHWVSDAQFPTGSQWTETIHTNAENRPKVGDIAILIHNKHLEEYCV